MGYVDKALTAHLKSLLHSGWVVLDGSEKLSDITHADINEHTVTLTQAGLPETTKLLLIQAVKTFGDGVFKVYTELGGAWFYHSTGQVGWWAVDEDGVLRYSLSQANDIWDIRVFGYFHGGRQAG